MKKLKIIFVAVFILVGVLVSFGQESNNFLSDILKKNSIDLSVGGNGQFLSLNYGRVIKINQKSFINASIGLGATFFTEVYGQENLEDGGAAFPHQLTINFGENNSFFEVGIGGVFWKEYIDEKHDQIPDNSYFSTLILGYRHYFFKRVLFKAYATPILVWKKGNYDPRDFPTSSYVGASIGFAF